MTLKWQAISWARVANTYRRELWTEIRSHVFTKENGWNFKTSTRARTTARSLQTRHSISNPHAFRLKTDWPQWDHNH